jgi:hypothetical protein
LQSAVGALALSITAFRNRENLLYAIVAQYEESLRLLADSLAMAGDTCDNKLVAAVMCLALTEVILLHSSELRIDGFGGPLKHE